MKNDLARRFDINNPVPPSLHIDTSQIALEKDHRCKQCNKLLGVEHLHLPSLDIKCVRCGHINSIIKEYDRQVIITDKKGVILYVNEQVTLTTGYSPNELLGKTPAIWGNQMNEHFYKDMWNQILVQKRAIVVNVTNRHKDGTLYPVILRISPILDIDGDIELLIGMESVSEDASTKNVK